uniref:Uncharacterized protein n=1 Tax=Arundo donax TaxID=35708 RepID=A0A0A8ZNQ5_ARUDO
MHFTVSLYGQNSVSDFHNVKMK